MPISPFYGPFDMIEYSHTFRGVPMTSKELLISRIDLLSEKELSLLNTVQGNAIDYTAKRTDCSHQAVFDMRHKVLLALRQLPEASEV